MIRLLEFSELGFLGLDFQALIFEKASEVDAGINTAPDRERVTPGDPP
jgi:hypothetical protein